VLAHVAAVLAEGGRAPQPEALAEAVGQAMGAEECVLGIDGQRYRWGDGSGAGTQARRAIDDTAFVEVRAARARLDAVAEALAPVVALIRLQLSADRSRRAGQAAAAKLEDGRWRAAAEMDTERRRLERDLHDGTQHHLVALRMALALAEHELAAGGDVGAHVEGLAARLGVAEESLLRIAAGVLPVALVADGLAAALAAELRQYPDVRLDVSGLLRRYPEPVETAVYFVCLEAVNNAHKHAPGGMIEVRVHDTYGGLRFIVRDNGPGIAGTPEGSGLHHLTARMSAVGGTARVESAPGAGTTIEGFVAF
jgi:signal transduction histidine kinase